MYVCICVCVCVHISVSDCICMFYNPRLSRGDVGQQERSVLANFMNQSSTGNSVRRIHSIPLAVQWRQIIFWMSAKNIFVFTMSKTSMKVSPTGPSKDCGMLDVWPVLSLHNICCQVKGKSDFLVGQNSWGDITGCQWDCGTCYECYPETLEGRRILIVRHIGCIRGHCGLSGTIVVYGTFQSAIFKNTAGSVAQHANVMGTLTGRGDRIFSSPLACMNSQANKRTH